MPRNIDHPLIPSPDGTIITVKIRPRSQSFRVLFSDQQITIECKNPAEKGKANREVTKELQRLIKHRAKIISGHNSRIKKILLESITPEKTREILQDT
jgi:uncharacterized protein (TIGR00251 family)